MTKQNSHFDACNDTFAKATVDANDGAFANGSTYSNGNSNTNAIAATQLQRNNATNQPDPYTFPYGKIIFKDKLNAIAVVDGAYFLIVWNKRMEREHIAPTAYEFDGHLKRIAPNGERETVCDGLIRMIQNQGAFYAEYRIIRDGSRERKDPRNDSGIGLDQALYMLYHNASLDKVKAIHIYTSKEPIKLEGNVAYNYILQEMQDFYKTYFTLDYRIAAIRSDEFNDIWHNKGAVIRGKDNHILISCGEKIFYTDYDDGLFDLLKSIPSWEVKKGALRGGISDAARPNLKMSLSSIVGAYHNGLFDDTITNIREKLEDTKASFDKLGILYDHMTENKRNNFYYNLLALPKNVEDGKENPNNKLFNLRTRIKAPYFFYSVCDHSRKKILVHCGIEGGGYERRIQFPESDKGKERYVECFTEFKNVVKKAGYLLDKPGLESRLYYWSDPERANDEGNPLTEIFTKPPRSYERYRSGIFADMPMVEQSTGGGCK